jgi:hypothetical protein
MKYKIPIAFFSMVCLLLSYCGKLPEKESKIDFSFSKLSEHDPSHFLNSYTIIPIETNQESYIAGIEKAVINKDNIYLLGRSGVRYTVYIFSFKGKYLNKINAQGRGPKEYQSVADFHINPQNGNISILDPVVRKIKNYNSSSVFQSEFQLDCWAKEIKYFINGGKTFIALGTKASNLETGNNLGFEIYLLDGNYETIYSTLNFTKPIGIALGNGIQLTENNNNVNYLQPNTNLVYSINTDSARLKYTLQFPFDVLPGDEIENVFFKGKKLNYKYVYNIIYFESGNSIYVQFMHDKKVYWGLYSKTTKESVLFNEFKDTSCGCGVTLNLIGTYNNSFILETDVTKIGNVLRLLDPDKKRCTNPEIFNMIDTLDVTSNPLLILADFKF